MIRLAPPGLLPLLLPSLLLISLSLLGCGETAAPRGGITAQDTDTLVFSYFRDNGETGLFLATSDDGMHWVALNGDQPLLAPTVGESKLMRDPSITRGPDGRYHMVWTTSWDGKTIGYSSSSNLRDWTPQKAIPVMEHETGVKNTWAPEIFFDAASSEFVVVWASTIEGRFPETLATGERGRNHRLYSFRTKDFQTIAPTQLFYDPGFLVIDAALFEPLPVSPGATRYAMVVKNETRFPPAKNIYLTFAPTLQGPWSAPSAPFSGQEWAEGPTIVRIGDSWYVYFDEYRASRYGAVRSKDLQSWETITDMCSFPKGMKHGTVFRAAAQHVDALRTASR